MNCQLKCPFSGGMVAINVGSVERDALLVYGYIRSLWKLPEFHNMKLFPQLLQLIAQRISIEYIHIHSRWNPRKQHFWKIDIDHIFSSIISD